MRNEHEKFFVEYPESTYILKRGSKGFYKAFDAVCARTSEMLLMAGVGPTPEGIWKYILVKKPGELTWTNAGGHPLEVGCIPMYKFPVCVVQGHPVYVGDVLHYARGTAVATILSDPDIIRRSFYRVRVRIDEDGSFLNNTSVRVAELFLNLSPFTPPSVTIISTGASVAPVPVTFSDDF